MKARELAERITDFMEAYNPWELSNTFSNRREAIREAAKVIKNTPHLMIEYLTGILEDLNDEDQQKVATLIIALQSVA